MYIRITWRFRRSFAQLPGAGSCGALPGRLLRPAAADGPAEPPRGDQGAFGAGAQLHYYTVFYSVLFCSVLFYSVLFYSILFCSVLFYSIEFYSILFHPFQNTIIYYAILYDVIKYCIELYVTILYRNPTLNPTLRVQSRQIWSTYGFSIRTRNYCWGYMLPIRVLGPLGPEGPNTSFVVLEPLYPEDPRGFRCAPRMGHLLQRDLDDGPLF